MSNDPLKMTFSFFTFLVIAVTLITALFVPIIGETFSFQDYNEYLEYDIDISKYFWPIPDYFNITSPFGKRVSPTSGASSSHVGIDIAAPEGAKLVAITDGIITFTGFLGGGGYTITLSKDNMKITYCHVSPIYIVSVGDNIVKGQIIGTVGPKYVYNVPGNQYKDEYGIPTNGATTGTHLHFGIRINETYINPLDLYKP